MEAKEAREGLLRLQMEAKEARKGLLRLQMQEARRQTQATEARKEARAK